MENFKKYIGGGESHGKLSDLINHQSIYIDAHGKENDPNLRDKIFDDPAYDLHLHKETKNVVIHGKKEHTLDIRIPLNNDQRDVTIKDGNKDEEIPGYLRKEIRNALRDPKKRDKFAKEVAREIATYPSKKSNDDQERTEEVLRHIANAFGVPDIPVKDEWFTHIYHSNDSLSAYSIIDVEDQRFNFYASNNFIYSEKAEPTHKFILGLYGGASSGKSETIKIVMQILLERIPNHAVILENGEDGGDVKALLFIHGAKVAIESQGDPCSRQMQSIEDFTNIGCDIILSASRTRGMTTNSIMKHQDQYQIYWYSKTRETNREKWHESNVNIARFLADQIEAFAMAAFAGL